MQDTPVQTPDTNITDVPAYQPLTYDPALYEDDLLDTAQSEDQRQEMLQALWVTMCIFVDLDIPIPSPDAAPESCGQLKETDCDSGAESVDLVNSHNRTLAEPFERAGSIAAPAGQEES